MIKPNKKYRHKKSGDLYMVILADVTNCTNAQNGQKMIVYYKDGKFFAREEKEFLSKFEVAK